MRITIRWITKAGKSTRAPGSYSTVRDAEVAAKSLMSKYPQVTYVAIYHDTYGHVQDVKRES